jgi:hypothetical protein
MGVPVWAAAVRAATVKPGIIWEVENRYRYFKEASQFRAIAEIYESLKTAKNPRPSALQLEIALEQALIDGRLNLGSGGRREGWAANVFAKSCGREPDHRYAGCRMNNGDGYLEPGSTDLIVGIGGNVTGQCEWVLDGDAVATADCASKATIRNVTYDKPHSLAVTPAATNEPILASVLVKDVLVLGFGDSFSSGEGNPELPVRLRNDLRSDYHRSSVMPGGSGIFPPVRNYPARATISHTINDRSFFDQAADWTNPQCHRSIYSQHFKSTLQYALERRSSRAFSTRGKAAETAMPGRCSGTMRRKS